MTVTAVIGTQWGDEAKGKIVDLLAKNAAIVARFNGGDNAGHTVVNPLGTFKLRLTPNGFYYPETACVIGPGVVINLETLINEIHTIQDSGITLLERLWVSPRCHVVMPYHPLLEAIYEDAKGQGRTGTTRRGMGPTFADKVSYNGIRLADLANPALLVEKLRVQLSIKNPILAAFGIPTLDLSTVLEEKLAQFDIIRTVVRESFGLVQAAIERGAAIVLEGAQGALLDVDWGTYPFSTASTTLAGGASAGLGLAPCQIQRVVGVAKAYTSRVGAGPMPTELLDATGETLRREGAEFGTVTGRPRRCGWLDAAALRFTVHLNGVTELALTKLDVLDTLPTIEICLGYQRGSVLQSEGSRLWQYWEGDAHWLSECQPVYIEMEGWQQSTKGVRTFDQLPPQAQVYIRKVEDLVGAPVTIVSVGPGRDEIIPVPQ